MLAVEITPVEEAIDLDALLLDARSGDPDAAEDFFAAITPVVEKTARKFARDGLVEPEDLVQDSLERVLKFMVRGDAYEPGTARGYIYRLTQNRFLDLARRSGRVRFENDDELSNTLPAREDTANDALELSSTERVCRLLEGAGCDADQAEAFRLRYIEGLSQQEVADRMGVGPGTAGSRIHRALRKVQKQHNITSGTKRYDLFADMPDIS